VAAHYEIEGLLAQRRRDGPRRGADVELAVDVGPLDEIDADKLRARPEPLADQAAPVRLVAIRNRPARADLEHPRRAPSDGVGHRIEQPVDLAAEAAADDAQLAPRRSGGPAA